MKKLFLFFAVYLSIYTNSFSQQDDINPRPRPKNCDVENSCPKNTLFLETNMRFKNSFGLNSLNWDHTLICREKFLLSYIIGVDFWSFKKTRAAGIPLSLNLMLGGHALMLEIGAGLNFLYAYKNYNDSTSLYENKQSYLGLIGNIGLRYEKKHSIFFRAGYTPMYSLINYEKIPILASKKFNSMFGIGVGYTF